jgi:hypothetical protein
MIPKPVLRDPGSTPKTRFKAVNPKLLECFETYRSSPQKAEKNLV